MPELPSVAASSRQAALPAIEFPERPFEGLSRSFYEALRSANNYLVFVVFKSFHGLGGDFGRRYTLYPCSELPVERPPSSVSTAGGTTSNTLTDVPFS